MRTWIAALAALGIGLIAPACAPPAEHPQEGREHADPRAGMDQLAAAWDVGLNAEDVDAMLALYVDSGGAIMPNEQPAVAGKEAMRGFFEEFFAMGDIDVKNTVEAVVADGDHIVGKGSYTLSITNEAGETQDESGHWICVARRLADGSLKMVRNIWNRDAPLPGQPDPRPIAESGPPAATEAACYGSPKAINQAFEIALEAGDVPTIVAAHNEDGSRFPPNMPEMSGRATISRYYVSRFEPYSERVLDLTDIREATAGSIGMTHGRFRFNYTPKEGGDASAGEGKFMSVSTRGDDGCWRLQWVLWNADAPPATVG